MLELILAAYTDIEVERILILQLHRDMLKYSEKDERQRGNYKFAQPGRGERSKRQCRRHHFRSHAAVSHAEGNARTCRVARLGGCRQVSIR